jgi:hypothetical protein
MQNSSISPIEKHKLVIIMLAFLISLALQENNLMASHQVVFTGSPDGFETAIYDTLELDN